MKPPFVCSRGPRLALIAVLALGTVAALGCGDDKSDSKSSVTTGAKSGGKSEFEVGGKVDRFAGPAPLVVRLKATTKNAQGDVVYRWRFDDGTSSEKAEVTHTFKRAGYYQVILDGYDETGKRDVHAFVFGAWPPGQWARAQDATLTQKGAARTQKVQQARTEKRRKELLVELRRKAREQIAG